MGLEYILREWTLEIAGKRESSALQLEIDKRLPALLGFSEMSALLPSTATPY